MKNGKKNWKMKLSEYYKMINKIDGFPDPEPDPRITYTDISFTGGKGKEGSATIIFLDGVPVYLNIWIWDLDLDWAIGQVEQELGSKIVLSNWSGGNGHEGADLELVKENEDLV
jgi:hypothetical protein